MADQAEGLRQKQNAVRMLSVLAAPRQAAGPRIAAGLAQAWRGLGALPLLVDGSGASACDFLGCHPLHVHGPSTGKPLKESILVQEGRAAVVAKACPAGDGALVREAAGLGYRELVFDAGELDADDAPVDARAAQEILLLASTAEIEIVFALLKALAQADSPAQVWLLWDSASPESKRLTQVCSEQLNRSPGFLDEGNLSLMDHAFERNCLSIPLQDNDFLEIVTKMVSKQSVRGEETPYRKRHG